jgi:hypothetical protein
VRPNRSRRNGVDVNPKVPEFLCKSTRQLRDRRFRCVIADPGTGAVRVGRTDVDYSPAAASSSSRVPPRGSHT